MCIANTRTIALIASKKNFNPDKERLLIDKARTTKCRCRHFTGTDPCLYRSCRHFADTHYKEIIIKFWNKVDIGWLDITQR
jgi:hypothetical protein